MTDPITVAGQVLADAKRESDPEKKVQKLTEALDQVIHFLEDQERRLAGVVKSGAPDHRAAHRPSGSDE